MQYVILTESSIERRKKLKGHYWGMEKVEV